MDKDMSKKILITGSSGLVGSACVELFRKKGWQVTGIDNNQRAAMFDVEAQDVDYDIDIRDVSRINWLFAEKQFDAIIHAAAQPSHDYATNHAMEDFTINAQGTLILLEATRKYAPHATFLFVSTDKVYGEKMQTILGETDTRYVTLDQRHLVGFDESLGLDFAGDRSLFGCSKAAADMYVQAYHWKFGLKTVTFRPGCITGKKHQGAEFHGFLAYLAKCLKQGLPYNIHGNGKQVRDQIHASDLANAFWHVIENPKEGAVYNIGGGPDRSVSVLEAIALMEKQLGKEAGASLFSFAPERGGDRRWDIHDISKFCADYPTWDYTYSLQDIIKELCEI